MEKKIKFLISELNKVIIGNEENILLSIICLFAGGNLLIEDLPGSGKSTLARALAKCFGLDFKTIHFTNDLLPSDLIGINIFNSKESKFQFEPGPLFSNILLADEINRASPRTQSALLEAMNNKEISIDGYTKKLPFPFFVIASQNPNYQIGTSPLPESQLDRFLMRISLGKPTKEAEKEILKGKNINPDDLDVILSMEELIQIQEHVLKFHASEEIYDYILELTSESRKLNSGGLSTRAAKGILNASKSCAFLNGSTTILPDHVQFIFSSVAEHRLDNGNKENNSFSADIINEVDAIR